MFKRLAISFALIFLVIVGLNSLLPNPLFKICYNTSESMPYTLFLSRKLESQSLSYGAIISFRHMQYNIPLVKQVMGLPGDRISISSNHIYVNEKDLGEVKEISPSGRKMTPVNELTIPSGYLFVAGQHEFSFDSRYAEFGLVPLDEFMEVLWPLF